MDGIGQGLRVLRRDVMPALRRLYEPPRFSIDGNQNRALHGQVLEQLGGKHILKKRVFTQGNQPEITRGIQQPHALFRLLVDELDIGKAEATCVCLELLFFRALA